MKRLARLLALVADTSVRGIVPPDEAIMQQPAIPIVVSAPGQPPLDLGTYEARLQRWREGLGPALNGMEEFVTALRTCPEPTRALSVRSSRTHYTYLLDVHLTRVIAAVAIDVPADPDTPKGMPRLPGRSHDSLHGKPGVGDDYEVGTIDR